MRSLLLLLLLLVVVVIMRSFAILLGELKKILIAYLCCFPIVLFLSQINLAHIQTYRHHKNIGQYFHTFRSCKEYYVPHLPHCNVFLFFCFLYRNLAHSYTDTKIQDSSSFTFSGRKECYLPSFLYHCYVMCLDISNET